MVWSMCVCVHTTFLRITVGGLLFGGGGRVGHAVYYIHGYIHRRWMVVWKVNGNGNENVERAWVLEVCWNVCDR